MTSDHKAADGALADGASIARTGGWLTAEIGDELVMMSAASDRYIGLSESGRRIWELLAAPLTLSALCAALAEEYEAPDGAVAADVTKFLHEMLDLGAVTLGPPPTV
jgi:hypothetical protein